MPYQGKWVPRVKRGDLQNEGWGINDADDFYFHPGGGLEPLYIRVHCIDSTEHFLQAGGVGAPFLRTLWYQDWELKISRVVGFNGGRYIVQVEVRKQEHAPEFKLSITMLKLGITYPTWPSMVGTEEELSEMRSATFFGICAGLRMYPTETVPAVDLPFLGDSPDMKQAAGKEEEDATVAARAWWADGNTPQRDKENASRIVALWDNTVERVGGDSGAYHVKPSLLFKRNTAIANSEFDFAGYQEQHGYNVSAVHTSVGLGIVPCAIFSRELQNAWGLGAKEKGSLTHCFLGNHPRDTKENLNHLPRKAIGPSKRKRAERLSESQLGSQLESQSGSQLGS